MSSYDQYKLYLDLLTMVLLPFVSFLVGITLSKVNKLSNSLQTQTEQFMRKVEEVEKKIDERDERMRTEFNTRFLEERQLVYRLLDAMNGDKG